MLGDSVKRRMGGKRKRSAETGTPRSRRWKAGYWALIALGATLPFALGYVLAVRVIFPPPPVVAQGIPVPALTGETAGAAQRELESVGLGSLEVTRLPSPTAPENTIIAQSPLPGQQLRTGASVRVAISSGRPRVVVPDVMGFPVDRAAGLLTRLGFDVQRIDTTSSEAKGRVIGLNPEAGERLQLPARVTILVSAGVDTTALDTVHIDTLASPGRGWSASDGKAMFVRGQQVTRCQTGPAEGEARGASCPAEPARVPVLLPGLAHAGR